MILILKLKAEELEKNMVFKYWDGGVEGKPVTLLVRRY